MADANITSSIQLELARHQISMEVAYEVEVLSNILRDQAKKAGDDTEYSIRSLAIRLNDLAGILMSALSTDLSITRSTNDLSRHLRGEGVAEEDCHV